VISDFKKILGEEFRSVGSYINLTYTFENKTMIRFKTGDDPDKFAGPRQDMVYFDEINHIKEETWVQATSRTAILAIASFNPSRKFWITDEMTDDSCAVIHSTYKDNIENIENSLIERILNRAERDSNFKRVYINGEWGSLDGLIFEEDKHYFVVPEIPEQYRHWRSKKIFASDYGFDNDPTTLVELEYLESPDPHQLDKLIVTEHFYGNKTTANMFAPKFKNANPNNIKCVIDSAGTGEFVYTLSRDHRLNIEKVRAKTGIAEGLNQLKNVEILIIDTSTHIIDEFRNLSWAKDRDGKAVDKPIPGGDHTIDAIRYGFITLSREKNVGEIACEML
jgi:phage terminase large subunit